MDLEYSYLGYSLIFLLVWVVLYILRSAPRRRGGPPVGMQLMIGFSSLAIGAPGLAGMQTTELRDAGKE